MRNPQQARNEHQTNEEMCFHGCFVFVAKYNILDNFICVIGFAAVFYKKTNFISSDLVCVGFRFCHLFLENHVEYCHTDAYGYMIDA